MRHFYLLLFLLVTKGVQSQIVRQPLSIRYAGLGAYSLKFSDVFSATSNLASLAQLKQASFGIYGERRFLLDELNGYTAIVAAPVKSGTFGLQADYFGSSIFNESQIGLLYARKVTDKIDVGIKFNYHSVKTPGYGTAASVNFEGGAIFHLTDKLHTGIHVYNPTSSKLGKTGNEKLASIYRFGAGYEASDKVFVSAEIVKQEDRDVNVNAGLQYNIHEKVFIRAGISSAGSNSYAGVGLQLSFARVDINAAYHPQLGFTPGLLLLFNLTKRDKQ